MSIAAAEHPSLPSTLQQMQELVNRISPSVVENARAAQATYRLLQLDLTESLEATKANCKLLTPGVQRYLEQIASITEELAECQSWYRDFLPSETPALKVAIEHSMASIIGKKDAGPPASLTDETNGLELLNADYAAASQLISDEESKIIADELTQAVSNPENWQQRIIESARRFQETNPLVSWILQKFILVLLLGILAAVCATAIGNTIAEAKIRAKPSAASEVIYTLEASKDVLITDEAPYYYEVSINADEQGQQIVGYMSKRVVKVLSTMDNAHDRTKPWLSHGWY